MRKSKITITIWGCICILLIASLVLLPAKQAKAEKLVESTLFYRIYLAYSVDQNAAQAWLPAPWKAVSLPKGPFKGANLFVLFTDWFIIQDGEGKPEHGGTYCCASFVAFGKNPQTKKFASFVTRVYAPYDDSGPYKNTVKAMVSREATIKSAASEFGTSSEVWKVQHSAGGILEFRMDYKRAVPRRTKREYKVRSNVEPDSFRIYRDDYADDLLKSVAVGIDRVQNFKFRTTISELRKMFDGSEKLVGITVNPCRVRQAFLP
jgi:hypothetical protein